MGEAMHMTKDEKTFPMTLLLDFYGELLSPSQREALEMFYGEDLSLGEIASVVGITRQGVRDRIVKGEKLLTDTEAKLGLVARFSDQKKVLSEASERLGSIRAYAPQVIDDVLGMLGALL